MAWASALAQPPQRASSPTAAGSGPLADTGPRASAVLAKPRHRETRPVAPVVVSSSRVAYRGAARPAARNAAARRAPPPPPSVGQLRGLHAVDDELDLRSAVALVVDRDSREVLFSKNSQAVLPIASITKLMTALVVIESGRSPDEVLTVTAEDARATAGANQRRRIAAGTRMSRGELLHLALMASENRAAHALARSHSGGTAAFVQAMNAKARSLGMTSTRYVEPTGLASGNRSSAEDLALLVGAAAAQPLIRDYSTSAEALVGSGRQRTLFRNTNGLVHHPEWEIAVQKTGYIAAAGRCVVMQAQMAGRRLIMVLLDSAGRYSRIADAERLRRWLQAGLEAAAPAAAAATAHSAASADSAAPAAPAAPLASAATMDSAASESPNVAPPAEAAQPR
jgi:D-alanyl-D-alanine endopeptidase (penicillin-binding protein 7)